jgi:plasmid stabilization system protein ParE
MNTPFVLTPRAEQDLDEIWEYIAADKIDAADRVLDKIAETFEHLAQTPGIGQYREDLADQRHRFHLVHSYLIVYRWETKPLQIIRILHVARDVQAILNPGAVQ